MIILLFDILDITEALKDRIRGRMSWKSLEDRITQLEKRVDDLSKNVCSLRSDLRDRPGASRGAGELSRQAAGNSNMDGCI